MFQFRRFPSYSYLFTVWYPKVGFPIRKSPDHRIFAPPRSLSQLIASFIGSWCQGIPLALLLAWSFSDLPNLRKVHVMVLFVIKNYAGSIEKLKQNCILLPFNFFTLIKSIPYCCLLLIAFHNHNVQFSRYIRISLRDSMKLQSLDASVNLLRCGGD